MTLTGPLQSAKSLQRLRHLWLLTSLIFLLIAAGSLGADTYFLHFDTPTQQVAASDLVHGCWGDTAASLAPVFLLGVLFSIFGIHTWIETMVLALLGALMAAALYRTAAQVTGSKRWALLGALWFISLPTMLYYTRMHLGYALASFVLGVMLCADRRWFWAGITLGLAILSHFNMLIPVALWCFWLVLLVPHQRFQRALLIAGGILAISVALEAVDFLYTGKIFGWVDQVATDAFRLTDTLAGSPWPITHLVQIMSYSNGWLNALLLAISLAYPFVRRPRVPLMDAIYLTGWSLLGGYSLRVALGNQFLTPRMFAAAYPLLLLASLFTLARLLARARRAWPQGRALQRAGLALGALLVAVTLPLHAVEAAAGSHTGYPAIGQAFEQAAADGRPVRYFGNFHVAQFYGSFYGVETSINETSPDLILGDSQAIWIVEGELPPSLGADGRLNRSRYEITRYPHLAGFRPALVEGYGTSPAMLSALAAAPRPIETSQIEVWQPQNQQGVFQARVDEGQYLYYYSGEGCVSPLRYGKGTANFYQVLLEKAGTVWAALSRGDVEEALSLVRTWISRLAGQP